MAKLLIGAVIKREILFAAKMVDNDKWVYGMPIGGYGGKWHMIKSGIEFSVYDLEDIFDTEINPNTISQYTDFNDRYGIKIFENHIVRNALTGEIGEIVWHRGSWHIWNNLVDDFLWNWCSPKSIKGISGGLHCEVIGNIYDNPELLEVGNERNYI